MQDHSPILPCVLEAGLLSSEAADIAQTWYSVGSRFLVGDYSTVLLNSNYDHMKELFSLVRFFFKVQGKIFFDEILIEENWSNLLRESDPKIVQLEGKNHARQSQLAQICIAERG